MPKYRNAGGETRDKCMVASYALVTKFGATQEAVAEVMGCSQATIANWVKEIGFKKEIHGLENELASANEYITKISNKLKLIEYNPSSR